ncbi:MAG: hypothetical protein GX801_08915 [Fibrobacter sp.]|nr:hypothetical protein [Fibrobacter sp.]
MGHIIFVAPNSDEQLDKLAHWTVEWILENEIPMDSSIYSCNSLATAEASIANPLFENTSPFLVVLGHGHPHKETAAFGENLRSCLPETWIIEIIDDKSRLCKNLENAFFVKSPVHRQDWQNILQHIFIEAASPQWSRTEI